MPEKLKKEMEGEEETKKIELETEKEVQYQEYGWKMMRETLYFRFACHGALCYHGFKRI